MNEETENPIHLAAVKTMEVWVRDDFRDPSVFTCHWLETRARWYHKEHKIIRVKLTVIDE